jgi:hypothetical protein
LSYERKKKQEPLHHPVSAHVRKLPGRALAAEAGPKRYHPARPGEGEESKVKIPVWILSAAFAALLALEGWTLDQVSNLRADVAVLEARFDDHFKTSDSSIPPTGCGVKRTLGLGSAPFSEKTPQEDHGAVALTQK